MQMWELEDHPVQFEGCVCCTKEEESGSIFSWRDAGNIGDMA